jgi:hypothetical protein
MMSFATQEEGAGMNDQAEPTLEERLKEKIKELLELVICLEDRELKDEGASLRLLGLYAGMRRTISKLQAQLAKAEDKLAQEKKRFERKVQRVIDQLESEPS